MRTTKELLSLLLGFVESNPNINFGLYIFGLCNFCRTMRNSKLISFDEFENLLSFIQNHRPSPKDDLYEHGFGDTEFYWNPWKIEPRINWIKYWINNIK
jgi:hypothetical protein